MIDTPEIVQTFAFPVALLRLRVPSRTIREIMMPAREELFAAVAAQGIARTGPWFTHHFHAPGEFFDFELGVPVASPIAPAGRVKPGSYPSVRAARTNHRGGYEGLGAAWGELEAWIAKSGDASAEELWECYAAGPESGTDPSKWRTELTRPLK